MDVQGRCNCTRQTHRAREVYSQRNSRAGINQVDVCRDAPEASKG